MAQCGIYKYVWNEEVIYVGKSNTDIEKRIKCHSREDKFQKYLADADIYFCFLPNEATTDIYELYYINKYRPVLNVTAKYDNEPIGVNVADIEWTKYNASKYWCAKNKKSPSAVIQYNNQKINWLKGMKESIKDISDALLNLKSIVAHSQDDVFYFNRLLRKNDDYNRFAAYANYEDTLGQIFGFLEDYKYGKAIWESYSDSFEFMIKELNQANENLK